MESFAVLFSGNVAQNRQNNEQQQQLLLQQQQQQVVTEHPEPPMPPPSSAQETLFPSADLTLGDGEPLPEEIMALLAKVSAEASEAAVEEKSLQQYKAENQESLKSKISGK